MTFYECTATILFSTSLLDICNILFVTLFAVIATLIYVHGIYSVSKYYNCDIKLLGCKWNVKKSYKVSILFPLIVEAINKVPSVAISLAMAHDLVGMSPSMSDGETSLQNIKTSCNISDEKSVMTTLKIALITFLLLRCLSAIFVVLSYYLRLVLLFQDSMFDINKKSKNVQITTFVFCIIMILFTFGALINVILFGIELTMMFAVCFLMFNIVNVGINMYLSIVLYRNLKKFLDMLNNLNIINDISETKQKKTAILLKRLTLLISVACITTLIRFFIMIIDLSTGFIAVKHSPSILRSITEIDVFINTYCLLLQFDYYDKYYFSCCKLCHIFWLKDLDTATFNVKDESKNNIVPTQTPVIQAKNGC